jgi:ketosteroid isomerase-like protein
MTDSAPDVAVVARFYEALAVADAAALLTLLHPSFVGITSPGLPDGWGEVYDSAQKMLRDCWGRIFAKLVVRPEPREYLRAEDGRIVVVGKYVGRARGTGRMLDAQFVHFLRLKDDRILELEQITDTARWRDALGK